MTKVRVAIIETLIAPKKPRGFSTMATTKWRPALIDETDKIVWRGDLCQTADEAKTVATKKQTLAIQGLEIA
jgi:hypothetical protein